jgi:hypothetical protein
MRQDHPGIYDLSDHSSLFVGGRERGMGVAVPKEGNVMTLPKVMANALVVAIACLKKNSAAVIC